MATRKQTKQRTNNSTRRIREKRVAYAAPRFYWLPITEEKIRQAAQKIVDAVHPEK